MGATATASGGLGAGGGGGTPRSTVHCPDGTSRTLDHLADLAEIKAVCGIVDPPPPTAPPTAPPLPRIVAGGWTDADGSPIPTFCTIPPDDSWRVTFPDGNWCPPWVPRAFRWEAHYDNGAVLEGLSPVLSPGQSWSVRPNGWNGVLDISYRVDGIGSGWGFD